MEYILIAWFSMLETDTNIGNNAFGYGYGFATSISQEFDSEAACNNAGQALLRKGVGTDGKPRGFGAPTPSWKFICVPKGDPQLATEDDDAKTD